MPIGIKTEKTIYSALEAYFIANCNEVTDLNKGSYTRSILEALSLETGEINLDWYLSLEEETERAIFEAFDFERKSGISAIGYLTFLRDEPSEIDDSILAGSIINYNGSIVQTLETMEISIGESIYHNVGDTNNEITASFIQSGSENNIDIGMINTKIGYGVFEGTKPENIHWAKNESPFTNGTDFESDEEMIERFRIFIQGLTRTTPLGIRSGVMKVDKVYSSSIRELDPVPGWVTVYAEEGNGTLSEEVKTEIKKVMNGDRLDPENYPGYRGAGIKIEVKPPTPVNIPFTVEVDILRSTPYDPTALENLVKSAIVSYVNNLPMDWDCIISEVETAIQNADSDVYDVRVTIPSDNITIDTGFIARTSSSLITVIISEVNY